MAPIVKLKGPIKGNNLVSVYSVSVLSQNSTVVNRNLNVKIRLPSTTLRSFNNDDSELSSLDYELNQALQNDEGGEVNQSDSFKVSFRYPSPKRETPSLGMTLTQNSLESPLTSPASALSAPLKVEKVQSVDLEENSNNTTSSASPTTKDLAGYRTIPPNLIIILKREFGLLNETAEELSMIEKIIFTLRDPLSTTKIRLPVKAIVCNHFECFDFDNFCLFNHLPTGIKNVLRKDLIKRSNDLKKRDKKLTNKNKDLNKMDVISLTKSFIYQPNFNTLSNLSNTYPMYKCPICNKSFELNQLFISDIFNYFIKTTPIDIDRIELRDMIKYRIVDDEVTGTNHRNKTEETEEIILLSDDETEEEDNTTEPRTKMKKEQEFGGSTLKREFPDFNPLDPTENGRKQFKGSTPGFDTDLEDDLPIGQRYQDEFDSSNGFNWVYHKKNQFEWNSNHQQSSKPQDEYNGSGSWEDPVTLD